MNASRVFVQHGTEGPSYDPYSYEEVIVMRPDGRKVTMHAGLGNWLKVKTAEGRKISVYESEASVARLHELFEYHAGVTVPVARKALEGPERARLKAHAAKCGSKNWTATSGFPGESFDYCEKCGLVAGYHFNASAVE